MENLNRKIEYQWDSSEASWSNAYLLPKILPLLPTTPSKILDMGCGNGFLTSKIADLGHAVVGVDNSNSGIEQATRAFPRAQFLCRSVLEDMSDFENRFDCVISSEVIEHLAYPKVFLRNCRHALKPGGTFIISTPYHGYLKNLTLSILNLWDQHFGVDWDGGHIKFFSKKTLGKMLHETGFADLSFHPAGRFWGLWKSSVFKAKKSPY